MKSYKEQEEAAYRKAEQIIAEQNRRQKIIFLAAVSSCLCTAACAGIWFLASDNIRSVPKYNTSESAIIDNTSTPPEMPEESITTAPESSQITNHTSITSDTVSIKNKITTVSSTDVKDNTPKTTRKNSQTSVKSSDTETIHTDNTSSNEENKDNSNGSVSDDNHESIDKITIYDKSQLRLSDVKISDDMKLTKQRTAEVSSNGESRKADIYTVSYLGEERQALPNGGKTYYAVKYEDSDEYFIYEPDNAPVERTVDNIPYIMYYGENQTIFWSFSLTSVPEEKLGSYLGRAQFEELIIDGERPKAEGEMYEIQGISSDYAVAIKVDGSDKYTIFCDVYYTPDTLGQMMDEQGLLDNMVVVGASVGHNDPVKYKIAPGMVTELLENSRNLLRCQDDSSYLSEYVKIKFDLPLYNLYDRSIEIDSGGYMSIHSVSSTICVFIGEENAKKFIEKVQSEGISEDW